jgi:drug/metabolite transporter (DMT)-like permease
LLIVLSTAVSAIYNVALKAIFLSRSQILGVFETEGLISPTLGNSLLILMLRMLVVVPLMLVLAPILHPRVWQDLQNLIDSVRGNSSVAKTSTKRVLLLSVVSGGFLFLSQVLIYVAIGQIQTGIAIALLFVYPVISGLLSSFLFRDRLNSFHIGAIGCIIFGEFLVLSGSTNTGTGNVTLGTTTAIASGIAFALYVILTRICATKLHPVSFTLINFATMLLLCFLALMLPYPSNFAVEVDPNHLLDLVLSAFILGVLTLVGYLLNNVGIRKFGATRSAIVGATVPALTVIIAGLIIQETLPLTIVLGVLLVTGGAAAFSFEKMRSIAKTNRTTN